MSAIGVERQRAQNYFKSFKLSTFREILSSADFIGAADLAGCSPRRCTRVLIPEVVAWLMMYVSLQVTSMTDGLAQAWGFVAGLLAAPLPRAVTEEAFSQARGKLKRRFWRILSGQIAARYLKTFDGCLRFKGRYLVKAIDGTELTLGKCQTLAGFFGRPANQKGPAPLLCAQNFRSHTPLGIHKELYAQLMLWNLTRWVMTQAAMDKGTDAMTLSFQNALTQIKAALLPLAMAKPEDCDKWYRHLLAAIAAVSIQQRPGRSYPRLHDGKVKDKGKRKKKLPARLPAT